MDGIGHNKKSFEVMKYRPCFSYKMNCIGGRSFTSNQERSPPEDFLTSNFGWSTACLDIIVFPFLSLVKKSGRLAVAIAVPAVQRGEKISGRTVTGRSARQKARRKDDAAFRYGLMFQFGSKQAYQLAGDFIDRDIQGGQRRVAVGGCGHAIEARHCHLLSNVYTKVTQSMDCSKARLVVDADDGIWRIRDGPQALGSLVPAGAGQVARCNQGGIEGDPGGFQPPAIAVELAGLNL
jgi:hypothetical protein